MIDSATIDAACCSIVRGGRFGMTRSGSGAVGAIPYLKGNADAVVDALTIVTIVSVAVEISSFLSPPLPVDPTSVTLLTFEGDVGALGTRVSALPEAEIEDGTPRKPSDCGILLLLGSIVSSMSVEWIIVVTSGLTSTSVISVVTVSAIHGRPVS